jgi:DNA topoisomerase-1
VSEYLGNTPTVCRSSYIDPRVIDRYLAGDTIPAMRRRPGSDAHPIAARDRRRIERSVLALLEEPSEQIAA